MKPTFSGALPQSQLQDDTFALTDPGPWAVDVSRPAINAHRWPFSAVAGDGKQEIVVCASLMLSLPCDHRASAGAPGSCRASSNWRNTRTCR